MYHCYGNGMFWHWAQAPVLLKICSGLTRSSKGESNMSRCASVLIAIQWVPLVRHNFERERSLRVSPHRVETQFTLSVRAGGLR